MMSKRYVKEIIVLAILSISILWFICSVCDDTGNQFFEKDVVSVDVLLGQNFIVGIPDTSLNKTSKDILHEIKPGGVVLYRRNFESSEQFKLLIQELQMIAQEESGVPYFIMLDEEPNGASRLDLLKDTFTLGLPDWGSINTGIEVLADLGITVELAPVVDFPFNEDSFIRKRVPVDTPQNLMAFNNTFIELLAQNNISATLKHFPGAGVFVEDPHHAVPKGYVEKDFFDQSLSLFESGIKAGADFVMINHAIYENIDTENPATLSQNIVTGLLREQLGFKGLIITDDIEDMLSPIWGLEPADAGVRALKAGNTMIMYSHDLSETLKTYKKIFIATKTDNDLREKIQSNHNQIVDFKKEKERVIENNI